MKQGNQKVTHSWRWANGVPIRDGEDALLVNWLEIVITNAKGKVTYRNSFITDLPLDANSVGDLAAAGRARWKIENETFNVLKTKGYHLEHNFGHGKKNLSAVLATLNLIAFAIHTAVEIADENWKLARKMAGTRLRFFNHIQALTTFYLFESWQQLIGTIAFKTPPPAQT